jgi:transposase-like protein
LKEATEYFSDPKNCRDYMVGRRWPDGVTCPQCESKNVKFSEKHNRWQCSKNHPLRQFTLKTGTVMEDSPIGLDKWLMAMWQIVNSKNGISSWEVHRAIGVTQKTAWFLDHRIRFALGMDHPSRPAATQKPMKHSSGGKAWNMHMAERKRRTTGTGGKDKTAVRGILERGKDGKPSHIRTTVVPSRKQGTLQAEVRKHVEAGAALYTDALPSYNGLEGEYAHKVIDHAVTHVDGKVENFWSLLKRGICGTYEASSHSTCSGILTTSRSTSPTIAT